MTDNINTLYSTAYQEFTGGYFDKDSIWHENPLPDVGKPFTLLITRENVPFLPSIIRRIFTTISPCFLPFIPPYKELPDKYSLQQDLEAVFKNNGMAYVNIRICF